MVIKQYMMKDMLFFAILILIELELYLLESRRAYEQEQEYIWNQSCVFYRGDVWNHNRSLMSMFRGRDDLGVICVNDWYVMDMQIRNLDGMGGGGSGRTVGTEEPAAFRRTEIRNGEFQRLQ